MPSTLIVGNVIHYQDLSSYDYALGGYRKDIMFGSRGFFSGGDTGPPKTKYDTIEYVNIGSQGNAQDSFAEMQSARSMRGAMSDGMRGLITCGATPTDAVVDTIDYINIQSIADAQDFGESTGSREFNAAATDGSRGLMIGGNVDAPGGTTLYDIIDYVTIPTTANAIDFGNLTAAKTLMGALSDGHYACIGGSDPSSSEITDYVVIANLGNAVDWAGELTGTRRSPGSASDGSRGVWAGWYTPTGSNSNIDYITIGRPGCSAVNSGDLTQARQRNDGVSDGSRGIFGGGYISPLSDIIDYIAIAINSDATDFGDLTAGRFANAGASGA